MADSIGHDGSSTSGHESRCDDDECWEFVPRSLNANPRFIRVYTSKTEIKRAFESQRVRTNHVYRKYRAGSVKRDSDKGEWVPIPDTMYADLGLSKGALILAEKKMDRQVKIVIASMGVAVVILIVCAVWYFTSTPKLPSIAIPEDPPILGFSRHGLRDGERIGNERLLLLYSSESVITDSINGSPLSGDMPRKVRSYNKLTTPSILCSAVVLEETATEAYASYYFEGSVRVGNLFAGIYRHIPRIPIAQIPVQVIESLCDLAGSIFRSREETVSLYVDNALGRDVRVCLDGKVGPRLPAKHHMRVVFRPGKRNLTIVDNSSERQVIETFTARFPQKDETTLEWYIFNIGGANSYSVKWVEFQRR